MVTMRGLSGERPLLALTADDCARARTFAIVHGADDAIHAAGAPEEIGARLTALLRRRQVSQSRLACDELEIDLIGRHVFRAGRPIAMPLREFDLLTRLARSPGQVVSRHDLLRVVWRINFDPGTNRIEVHMSRLRRRIDSGYSYAMLRTVKGAGYALVGQRVANLPALMSAG